MNTHDYLGVLWVFASVGLAVWGLASAVTLWTSHADRTRARMLITLTLVSTAFVIGDIARLRWRWEPFGIRADSDAAWLAIFRSGWVLVLWLTTYVLYWPRFRSWLGRMRR